MAEIVIYGEKMPYFELSREHEALHTYFWTASEAAKHWGCHPNTAREYIRKHPRLCRQQLVAVKRRGQVRILKLIPAGSRRHLTLAGNPKFHDSIYQRRLAMRRWTKRRWSA